jgi:hypothetical protein
MLPNRAPATEQLRDAIEAMWLTLFVACIVAAMIAWALWSS